MRQTYEKNMTQPSKTHPYFRFRDINGFHHFIVSKFDKSEFLNLHLGRSGVFLPDFDRRLPQVFYGAPNFLNAEYCVDGTKGAEIECSLGRVLHRHTVGGGDCWIFRYFSHFLCESQ